ncbi:hypothetical protein IKF81_00135, partial [Candidatus Saccharibacteria bacterium]|nr:hypothetical protein [Candidatus Saccharibacteria bacterium]
MPLVVAYRKTSSPGWTFIICSQRFASFCRMSEGASPNSFLGLKRNSRISRGDYERTQSMAGVSRIALCSARLVD